MHTSLSIDEWQDEQRRHEERVRAATVDHLSRRSRGQTHPVMDFLFTYYSFTPSQLARWHPGAGVRLQGAAGLDRAQWRHYRVGSASPDQASTGTTAAEGGTAYVEVDQAGFLRDRSRTVDLVRTVVAATESRPAALGCFGLHEWAMVYRQPMEEVRHGSLPLRLGSAGTDHVVESHQLRCSHVDAFRFYTEAARSLNATQPTRESQVAMEQPGCLHAGMDLYKWAYKLVPLVPSDLVMDCFDLARDIRVVDMRASPYDVTSLGYEPIAIETPEGKAAYVAAQRHLAARGQTLRKRLLDGLAVGAT